MRSLNSPITNSFLHAHTYSYNASLFLKLHKQKEVESCKLFHFRVSELRFDLLLFLFALLCVHLFTFDEITCRGGLKCRFDSDWLRECSLCLLRCVFNAAANERKNTLFRVSKLIFRIKISKEREEA